MRQWLLATVAAALMLPMTTVAESSITLDNVVPTGVLGDSNTIMPGTRVQFILRITYTPGDGSKVTGFTNGFSVGTYRNGLFTDSFDPLNVGVTNCMDDTCWWPYSSGPWCAMWDLTCGVGWFSVDGVGEDTVAFRHGSLFNGMRDPYDEPILWISTGNLVSGDTICLDSVSEFPPGGPWSWAASPGGVVYPDWSGPHCFRVACCVGDQGNVDRQGSTNVADLTTLVNYVFPPHDSLICSGVGNVDGQEISGSKINVADVTYLVAYLFLGGPPPVACEVD